MNNRAILPLYLRAELSRAEFRELRMLAAERDQTIQRLIGSLLRDQLRSLGKPVEESVKA